MVAKAIRGMLTAFTSGGTSGGGCLHSVDDLSWFNFGDAIFPGVPVEADETLILLAWFGNFDLDPFTARFLIDGSPIGPLEVFATRLEGRDALWPAAFWDRAVVAAGTYEISLEFSTSPPPEVGGILVLHIGNACYREQSHAGG